MAKDYKYKLLFREMARPHPREVRPDARAPAAEVAAAAVSTPETPEPSTIQLATPATPPTDSTALVEEPVYDFAPVPPEPDDPPLPAPEPLAQTQSGLPSTPEPEPAPPEPVAEAVQAPEPEPTPIPEPPPPETVVVAVPEPEEPEPAPHESVAEAVQAPEPEPEPTPIPEPPPPEPVVVTAPDPKEPEPALPDPIPEPQAAQGAEVVPESAPDVAAPATEPPAPAKTQAATSADENPPAAATQPAEPPRARSAEQDRPTMPDRIRLPRVLLTNDDGIDAPGLQVLAEVAATFADEVWIIAPEHDQSGTSMSLALHHPRRIYRRGARGLAVSGSPADCIALASYMLRADPPALVLSGINAGQNVGDDANLSGTLGAALTAVTLGIPSIAISQCYAQHRDNIDWSTARARLPALLQELLAQGWPKDHCLSINLPPLPPQDVTEALWTRQAPRTINGYVVDVRTDLRGFDYCWLNITRPDAPAPEDTDLWAIEQGCISISCLSLDRSRPVPPESISLTGDDD